MVFVIDPVGGDDCDRGIFLHPAAQPSENTIAQIPGGQPGNGKAAQYAGGEADGAAERACAAQKV